MAQAEGFEPPCLTANGFQDRLVMTTSISLRIFCFFKSLRVFRCGFYHNTKERRSQGENVANRLTLFFLFLRGGLEADVCEKLHDVIGRIGKKHRDPMKLVHVEARVNSPNSVLKGKYLSMLR